MILIKFLTGSKLTFKCHINFQFEKVVNFQKNKPKPMKSNQIPEKRKKDSKKTFLETNLLKKNELKIRLNFNIPHSKIA